MNRYDTIIIGAGISGLSLAHYCVGAGMKTLVIEKSERTGGCFHSHRFGGDAAGFWLELGAHTCYNSYGNLLAIMEENQLLQRLVRREKVSFRMLVDSGIRSIPSQLNFLELLLSAPRIFTTGKSGESVASYYSRIVGRKNYERVFGPAFNAILSQRADDFPAGMLFNKRPRRKEILKSFTLEGGLDCCFQVVDLGVLGVVGIVHGAHVDGRDDEQQPPQHHNDDGRKDALQHPDGDGEHQDAEDSLHRIHPSAGAWQQLAGRSADGDQRSAHAEAEGEECQAAEHRTGQVHGRLDLGHELGRPVVHGAGQDDERSGHEGVHDEGNAGDDRGI